jgi:hypothetical protein
MERFFMEEPMSEDDCPDDRIVSFLPFELEGDSISLNFIREERRGDGLFRPLNVQLENSSHCKPPSVTVCSGGYKNIV